MSRGFRQQPAAEAGIQGASPAGARPAQLGWTLSRDQTGERWGSYTIHLHHSHGPGEPLWGHLQIISSLADLDAEAHRLWWLGHGVFLLALVAIAGASWWLAGLAMAPLLEAYRRQEQFSADVAHELRTPLANLLAIVEAERGAIADGPHSKTAASLDRVLNQGRRLEQLISDLLLLATLERPCPQTQKQVCDLADITSDVMEDFGELATAAQVELVPGPWAAPALVRGVNSELSRLIINLLSNALQHSPPGGRIGVELEQWGRHPNGGANLVLAHPTGLPVEEPWYLISNAEPALDLVWSYGRRFCCEQLFRDQKSGVFQLAGSGLRDPGRIDRLLLVIAIAVLAGSLQGYAISLAGLRRQVDPHWKRGMSFLRLGLGALQMLTSDATHRLMAWLPNPLQELEPCIPSRKAQQKQVRTWFSEVELPPRSRPTRQHNPLLAVA